MSIVKGIKAKLRNKENLPAWFDERVAICNTCPHNSKNNANISLKDQVRISHNFGKDACLICSCGIKDLASDPTVKCSAKEPKWDWITVPTFDDTFNLENYSPSKGNLTRDEKYYYYNFGDVAFKGDAKATLLLVTSEELDGFKVMSSCGCMKPTFSKHEKGYLIQVAYNTEIEGDFKKQVSIIYLNKENKKEYVTFWLKGKVCI